jgi:hypothetical protein
MDSEKNINILPLAHINTGNHSTYNILKNHDNELVSVAQSLFRVQILVCFN